MASCPVCSMAEANIKRRDVGWIDIECPVCGHFQITDTAEGCEMSDEVSRRRHLLSGMLRNVWERDQRFGIKHEMLRSWQFVLARSPLPIPLDTDIPAKADAILAYMRRLSEFPGKVIHLNDADFSVGYCHNRKELTYCCGYLVQQSLIESLSAKPGSMDMAYRITPSGWAYLSGIGVESLAQGFVAMSFNPDLNPVWAEGLSHGIANAGYKPLRIDSKEHINRIDDEIVAEIRKSRLVVADLTDRNAGAYFEAGFALGLAKPVFWTCKQSDIDSGNVHFDARQYSIVPWMPDKWPDLALRLQRRIEAVIGRGSYIPT